MRTNCDRKTFDSIGPWERYQKIALMCFYRPDYWRKIARFLSKLRRMNHCDFKGDSRRRMFKYAQSAMKDTKLPDLLKYALIQAVIDEFNFDPRDGGKETCILNKTV
jgi:hypothetical protein